MAKIVPSILSADPGRLAEQVREAVEAGGDRIQVDVMDGHFVPNLTFGPAVVEAVKRAAGNVPVEAHLMIEAPERFVAAFAAAGADYVLVQVESTPTLHRALAAVSEAGAKPGVVLNPATPVEALREVAEIVAMVLVMTVEPGFGGQRFIASSPDKIRRVAALVPGLDIEVDGGIDVETAPLATAAGATLLVAGSSVYGHPGGVAAGIQALRRACAGG
ncbi:MAG: ribulose-phosphate 3-epimerase [Candidatus Dormibacteraeota bacterium]|nr:ribulose-phosphate 3-epimerase [Candidatus Dormibacteraeota bacterium]